MHYAPHPSSNYWCQVWYDTDAVVYNISWITNYTYKTIFVWITEHKDNYTVVCNDCKSAPA